MVYLLWAQGTHRFKIGSTKGPVEKRVAAMQTSSPFPLVIQGVIEGSTGIERRLHERLRNFRVVGEWFDLPEAIVWQVLTWFGRGDEVRKVTTCDA